MNRIYYFLLLLALSLATSATAQAPKRWTSGELHDALQKLNFLGSALYLAAHPDDENTRMITWLANVKHANTAYLSLTRGDGGQNLVGPEIREYLGVIRTQELLAARRIDGGQQFFTRANDFGFSKHPDETFNLWDRDQVMEDVIWVIRQFQPDIIINRFDHRSPGRTHGHHTASAVLGVEAFDLTAQQNVYPEQLKHVAPWQPSRLFFNTSWWFYGSQEAFDAADKSNLVALDCGTYLPKRGVSVPEIAAHSRSQHKSQGFGSSGTRGEMMEYLELVKGDMPSGGVDPFEGINTTWSRVQGGTPIGKAVQAAIENFQFDNPAASLAELLAIQEMIHQLPDSYWKRVKTKEIHRIIEGVTGLFAEAVADDKSTTPGQSVTVKLEAINRSDVGMRIRGIRFLPNDEALSTDTLLANNKDVIWQHSLTIPSDLPLSNAYWLNKSASLGMYVVDDLQLRGLPETPAMLKVVFEIEVQNPKTRQWIPFPVERSIVYKTTDPVKGELYSPFEVTPPVFGGLEEQVYIFPDDRPQDIIVKVTAGRNNVEGVVKLAYPNDWRLEPASQPFSLERKDQETRLKFTLYPSSTADENFITPMVEVDGNTYFRDRIKIEYDHIPTQTLVMDATAKVVRLDVKTNAQNIGYIMGAGDEIPQALEQIGCKVTLLDDRDINPENLRRYDAVIMGVRAYNTLERMPNYQPALLQYVENGGTLVVQYNTNGRLKIPNDELAPYPLKISRDRVTVEEAPVRILAPEHPVMNTPNKITAKDFDGWVQERGLYFPNEWASEFTPILSCNDPDEPARDGGLLVAPYGKGHYIYTGYSWFRELPAGVPGAYRIFANLISLGNLTRP
ncbi:MAG: PIG-L family deacetylase [Saprospiraceae bacterium]